MKPVPKAGIFQVDLVGIELKLPYVARNPGYKKKVSSMTFFQENFKLASLGHLPL